MTNGKIYIYVTDKLPQGDGQPTPGPGTSDSNKKEESNLLLHYARDKIINTTKQAVMSNINFALNNIGNFTGNYQLQRDIESTQRILNSITNIGTSAWAGFKITGGNPWGALIGATVATFNEASGIVRNEILIGVQTKKANREVNVLRQRSGLNSLTDGSMGTEN